MLISRRNLFASATSAAMAHAKPGEFVAIPKAKHVLVVWNYDRIDHRSIEMLAESLGEMGFEGPLITTSDTNAPDIRIFDLDGLPEPETGLLRQLLAEAVEKNSR